MSDPKTSVIRSELPYAIMGTIIAPRERGRYAGYMGSVMAVSTVSGPLLGGLLVDTALGWRWCRARLPSYIDRDRGSASAGDTCRCTAHPGRGLSR